MVLIDGKMLAAAIRSEIKAEVSAFKTRHGRAPGLATLLVGDDPASQVYVKNKVKACEEAGLESHHQALPVSTTLEALKAKVRQLNDNSAVDGILLQLPLPGALDSTPVLELMDPGKDADGLHPYNLGHLFEYKTWAEMGASGIPLSCTPHGVIQALQRSKIPLAGRRAVVLGRSKLVGKPLAMMLQALDATVTMAHSRTKELEAICREADILVAAIGQPRFVKAAMVKEGAVVIDVGINRVPGEQGICGDVDFAAVAPKAAAITPVPGGIGPLTIAMLLYNTLQLAQRRVGAGLRPRPASIQ